jgi:hypothetical protein
MSADTLKRAQFFATHAGYATPPGRAACALNLARAEERGEAMGLEVLWTEEEEESWDGDCPAPKILLWGAVYRAEDINARTGEACSHASSLAAIGMVGVDSWQDPSLRVVEAELLSDALAMLDKEADALATAQAAELTERATYAAGGAP